ncbi:hypothetical protein HR059_07495 [Sinorhizobium meliloti WSM1022]|uniref:hypothetical protein n=1 Tax=Rhizobium meliloti TaxID=382 RepID=UPI000410C630|nr:hypothetical protein [Sinorhizobium meliloti]MDW9567237.1 hypothetical protein [Sinorhizobium meliloti]QKN14314.1 hypothetical protein HR059_07495 [Sinorhizobium meliloti WSM1022]
MKVPFNSYHGMKPEDVLDIAGDFTKRLREHLQQGDILRLEGGYGRRDQVRVSK